MEVSSESQITQITGCCFNSCCCSRSSWFESCCAPDLFGVEQSAGCCDTAGFHGLTCGRDREGEPGREESIESAPITSKAS